MAKFWLTTAYVSASITSAVDGMTTVSGTFTCATDMVPVGIS